ncbi:hypothetical protein [Streptomyces sp. 2131.1]|uniref:hypothetical protein n=1 Tax=Streptomyces sp. 2131.1 TaxID=1855346 RepID=UPI000B8881DC|nr:hypothetical protein [Streptomyces sp. 2131.1]
MEQGKHRAPAEYGAHQAPAHYEGGDGCLTTVIRIPVRVVVLLVVLPVRMLWDALVVTARAAERVLLRPLGRVLARFFGALWRYVFVPLGQALVWLGRAVFVWPWAALWRYVVVPVVRYGIVVPLQWAYARLLTPLGHGLRWVWREALVPAARWLGTGLKWLLTVVLVLPVVLLWRYVLVPAGTAAAWLVRYLVVVPLVWTYRNVLTPVGHGIARTLDLLIRGIEAFFRGLGIALRWLVVTLLVIPVVQVYRQVLKPVGREIAAALGVAWRVAGFVSRAVGRLIAWLVLHLVAAPVRWAYRTVCVPVGRVVRDAVLAPVGRALRAVGRTARQTLRAARETVRQARRDAWRALAGGPAEREPGELGGPLARTLGSATTVPSAVPGPEISPLPEKSAQQG